MSAAAESASPLRIRGAPRRLSALLPGFRGEGVAPVEVSLAPAGSRKSRGAAREAAPEAAASFPAFVLPTGELRIDLPRSTPPGVYAGTIRLGDREQPVTVEVEPKIRLRAFPKSLQVSGGPGEKITAELTLVNEGNTAAEIRVAYSFWFLDADGADRVLGRIFETIDQPGHRVTRIDRALDAMEEQFGGIARVRILAGAGEIAPGASVKLDFRLILPERLKPGHAYSGMWPLHNLHWPVNVTVPGETYQEEAPA